MLSAAAVAGDDLAGHPLWHLLAVIAAPAAIILAFRLYDHLRSPEPTRRWPSPDRRLLPPALATAGAALIHAAVCPEHLRERAAFGVFFALLSVTQLVWSIAILRRPSLPLLRAGAAGSAAVIALWLLTRTAGLPPWLGGSGMEPVGPIDLLATALEAATAVLCLRLAAGGLYRTRPSQPA